MIKFFSVRENRKDIILMGDVKWQINKHLIIKNLIEVPRDREDIIYSNNDLSKVKTWSVYSTEYISIYKESVNIYKAFSLIDAFMFIYRNSLILKFFKKIRTKHIKSHNKNFFKRNNDTKTI